jgi:hypothetical protein
MISLLAASNYKNNLESKALIETILSAKKIASSIPTFQTPNK